MHRLPILKHRIFIDTVGQLNILDLTSFPARGSRLGHLLRATTSTPWNYLTSLLPLSEFLAPGDFPISPHCGRVLSTGWFQVPLSSDSCRVPVMLGHLQGVTKSWLKRCIFDTSNHFCIEKIQLFIKKRSFFSKNAIKVQTKKKINFQKCIFDSRFEPSISHTTLNTMITLIITYLL